MQSTAPDRLGKAHDEQKRVCDAFSFFDKDDSGAIDAKEMRSAMQALGFRCSLREAMNLIDQCDADINGKIDLIEFTALVGDKLTQQVLDSKDQSRIQNRGALAHDHSLISKTFNTHADWLKEERKRLERSNAAALQRELRNKEIEYHEDISRLPRKKRELQQKTRCHPSLRTRDLRIELERAVIGKDFDLQDRLNLRLKASLEQDALKHEKEVEAKVTRLENECHSNHAQQTQSAMDRIKKRHRAAMKSIEIANKELALKAKHMMDSTARRHDRVYKMICGEAHDMGVSRMSSFGARYHEQHQPRGHDLPSIALAHTFTRDDNQKAGRQARRQARRQAQGAITARDGRMALDFSHTRTDFSHTRTQLLSVPNIGSFTVR